MSILPVTRAEYEALRAVADGMAVRAADRGPWANAASGASMDHTMQRLRHKQLMLVPARGGTPELTADGRASLRAHEAKLAEEGGARADMIW
ncbi:MAG TPA: hypothetical protein VHX59_00690 [Mycobacteriales bacterium]|nr:hypothetical protein [Mycobacteriales bacterium]